MKIPAVLIIKSIFYSICRSFDAEKIRHVMGGCLLDHQTHLVGPVAQSNYIYA
jgi:hypothetical protein